MKYKSTVILFCYWFCNIVLKEVIGYNITVENCTTSDGKKGYCREEIHCYYGKQTKFEKCAKEGYVCCPDSGVSYKMCLKYAEEVYEDDNSLIFIPRNRNLTKVSRCAISAIPLIIGGEKAIRKEFPHMALIGFGNNRMSAKWLCGGSLISHNYVLTAAHCTEAVQKGPAKWVILGVNKKNDSSYGYQEMEIEKKIIHPKFKGKANDIGLFKLKKNAKFTQYVRPACLDHANLMTKFSAIATGWGVTDFDTCEKTEYLMKVELDIVEELICRKKYPKTKIMLPKGVEESMLCAGVLAGGKDVCQGDSGGPLQVILEEPYCMYGIIAVSSFGHMCAAAGYPGIYSRVFSFIPWIESVVWPTK